MIKPNRATGLERLELQRLRDRVGRLYVALEEATEAENPLASGAWAPPVDLCETEKMILLRVELPGVSVDQIKIGLTNTKLRIWGREKTPSGSSPHHHPSLFGTQLWKVQPGGAFALDHLRAHCLSGVGQRRASHLLAEN